MSARHINPNQLRMFMRPSEVKAAFVPGDYNPQYDRHNVSNMWNEKRNENDGWMEDDISVNGVKRPITVMVGPEAGKRHSDAYPDATAVLANGHHRVQAAEDVEREHGKQVWIPIEHRADTDDAF